jgi:hypothetical protein
VPTKPSQAQNWFGAGISIFTLEEKKMLTDDELRQIMPNCPAPKRADYLP